jgi:site-specific DNA-cytosine methylase
VPTLRASQGGEGVGVVGGGRASKLTIDEWELLSGFPVGYTDIGSQWSESKRRHAIGNSFAVPVMRWIAQGIAKVDEVAK